MAIGLMFVDFGVAVSTFLLFGLMGIILYRLLQVRAKELGSQSAKLTVESNEKILEVLNSYRESVVRNRRQFYSSRIGEMRYAVGEMIAEATFLPYISKYVIESITVLGSLVLAGYEFGTKNAVHAVAVLAVFVAASSRIAPAALRIQQGILQIRSSTGAAQSTLELIAQVEEIAILDGPEVHSNFQYQGFVPSITIKNLNFKYPALNQFALSDINLEVNPGISVAVVGPSGVGKTTLIDLILGVLHPASGSVEISGVTPEEASKRWPGAISYVPQNIVIASGTIRENVSLGYPKILADDTRVTQALEIAKLSEVVSSLEGGLDAYVGEQGSKLSGGQRQRLGIARALFTGPRLLVLDEATSALDSQTEADISQAIYSLRGKVTILIVAHRLSTVRSADKVIYLNGGRIEAVGSFEEVRELVPDFDKQADLMGL
jgi:ABC-type multidrug transport system fused ATPase/permease subunit